MPDKPVFPNAAGRALGAFLFVANPAVAAPQGPTAADLQNRFEQTLNKLDDAGEKIGPIAAGVAGKQIENFVSAHVKELGQISLQSVGSDPYVSLEANLMKVGEKVLKAYATASSTPATSLLAIDFSAMIRGVENTVSRVNLAPAIPQLAPK